MFIFIKYMLKINNARYACIFASLWKHGVPLFMYEQTILFIFRNLISYFLWERYTAHKCHIIDKKIVFIWSNRIHDHFGRLVAKKTYQVDIHKCVNRIHDHFARLVATKAYQVDIYICTILYASFNRESRL